MDKILPAPGDGERSEVDAIFTKWQEIVVHEQYEHAGNLRNFMYILVMVKT